MFDQVCPGCGETYIPIPGMDSGHGDCTASRRGGLEPAYEWAADELIESAED